MPVSLTRTFLLIFLLVAVPPFVLAEPRLAELSKMLPNEIGGFHQLAPLRPLSTLASEGLLSPSTFRPESDRAKPPFLGAEVEYLSPDGKRFTVEIIRVQGDSDAYSVLTLIAERMRGADPSVRVGLGEVGTASVILPRGVMFFKGTNFLRVTDVDPTSKGSDVLVLARLLADRLDKGEGDIPVLVKHLSDWQNAQQQTLYAVNLDALKESVHNARVFEAVNFEGGAEAVVANYDSSQLVIIEFTTPQLAGDNDRRLTAKIQELRNQDQPVPTAYRRVGNYSVFVFNGQNEQTANQLIDQIKYEQVVQWLGDNPNLLEKAQREYYQTTAGVLLAVVKASGLSLLLCLAAGGFLGALLFKRRRAQQNTAQAFSDAGGTLRLNIDELTPPNEAAKLIEPGS